MCKFIHIDSATQDQHAATLGQRGQGHCVGNIERAVALSQAASITDAGYVHSAGSIGWRHCAAGIKQNRHTGWNDHIGHVRQVRHSATRPVCGIKPVAGRAAGPGHRIQSSDVGREAGLVGDGVVARISAGVAGGQRDGLAIGHVLVVEQAGGGDVHHVTSNQAGLGHQCCIHAGHVVAVVDLVGDGDATNRQRLGCDVRRRDGLIGDDVVVHIDAAVAAGQGHSLAVGNVFGVKRAGGTQRHRIADDPA